MPKDGFKVAMERHFTGKETEPCEILYFKVLQESIGRRQFHWLQRLNFKKVPV